MSKGLQKPISSPKQDSTSSTFQRPIFCGKSCSQGLLLSPHSLLKMRTRTEGREGHGPQKSRDATAPSNSASLTGNWTAVTLEDLLLPALSVLFSFQNKNLLNSAQTGSDAALLFPCNMSDVEWSISPLWEEVVIQQGSNSSRKLSFY